MERYRPHPSFLRSKSTSLNNVLDVFSADHTNILCLEVKTSDCLVLRDLQGKAGQGEPDDQEVNNCCITNVDHRIVNCIRNDGKLANWGRTAEELEEIKILS